MNDDILYKPEEIAQKLKITKGTVYEMIKRGIWRRIESENTFVFPVLNWSFTC